MGHIIRLVKSDPASWPDERDSLSNDLLRLWNGDEHETRCGQIERRPWQLCETSIPAEHFDVCQATFVHQFAR